MAFQQYIKRILDLKSLFGDLVEPGTIGLVVLAAGLVGRLVFRETVLIKLNAVFGVTEPA
jgi:hypothetical protein